jgi:hypothetical protein
VEFDRVRADEHPHGGVIVNVELSSYRHNGFSFLAAVHGYQSSR